MVGEGVVNLSKKAESVTDRESYIDFRLRLLGEQVWSLKQLFSLNLSEGKNLDLGALPCAAFLHKGTARLLWGFIDCGECKTDCVQVTKHVGAQGADPVLLSSGIHSFPFKLGLPLGLPSTFLGKHGWVQYFCKAAMREDSGLTHKNQQVFIIMNPIDLNLEPPILAVSIYSLLFMWLAIQKRRNPQGWLGLKLMYDPILM